MNPDLSGMAISVNRIAKLFSVINAKIATLVLVYLAPPQATSSTTRPELADQVAVSSKAAAVTNAVRITELVSSAMKSTN